MSYETFIPTVESARLLKEVEKHLVFAVDCNRDYEGDVKQAGDSVRILMAGEPTIYTITKDGTTGTKAPNAYNGKGKDVIQKGIGDAEELTGAEVLMQINTISYFNYQIGNIDKAQMSKKNLFAMNREASARKIAEEQDKYIASVMAKDASIQYSSSAITPVAGTPGSGQVNVLDFIDDLVLKFNDADIPDSTELVMEVSPKLWKIIKKDYRDLDTDNSRLLAGRVLGKYNDITIKKSTNCYKADGTNEYAFIRTKRAVAFANPLTETRAYEPEKAFADAVKGYSLYDAKVIRPKEVIAIKISHAS